MLNSVFLKLFVNSVYILFVLVYFRKSIKKYDVFNSFTNLIVNVNNLVVTAREEMELKIQSLNYNDWIFNLFVSVYFLCSKNQFMDSR